MQIRHLPALQFCPEWAVTLDSDEERRLSDKEIVRHLENCRGITWDHDAQRYALDDADLGPELNGTFNITRNGDYLAVIFHQD